MDLPIEILQEIYLHIPDDHISKIMTLSKKTYNLFNDFYWNRRSQKYFHDDTNHKNSKQKYISNFVNRFNKYPLKYEMDKISFLTNNEYRDMICIKNVIVGILSNGKIEINYEQYRNHKIVTEDKYKYLSHFYCNLCIAITENNNVHIFYYNGNGEILIKKTNLEFKKIEFNYDILMAIDSDNNIWVGDVSVVSGYYGRSILNDTFSETNQLKCIIRNANMGYLSGKDVYFTNHNNMLFKYEDGVNYNMHIKAISVYVHCYVLYIITTYNTLIHYDGSFKTIAYNVEQAYHMNDYGLIIIHLNEKHPKYINFKSYLRGQISTRIII